MKNSIRNPFLFVWLTLFLVGTAVLAMPRVSLADETLPAFEEKGVTITVEPGETVEETVYLLSEEEINDLKEEYGDQLDLIPAYYKVIVSNNAVVDSDANEDLSTILGLGEHNCSDHIVVYSNLGNALFNSFGNIKYYADGSGASIWNVWHSGRILWIGWSLDSSSTAGPFNNPGTSPSAHAYGKYSSILGQVIRTYHLGSVNQNGVCTWSSGAY